MAQDRLLTHGACISLGGRGVLILGAPGAGKSDLALRLIASRPPEFLTGAGPALLVSDDQIQLHLEGGRVVARPPAAIAGRMEVRGIGIVSVPFAEEAALSLVADLDAPAGIERLPEPLTYEALGVSLPLIRIDPVEASAPLKLWLAVYQRG